MQSSQSTTSIAGVGLSEEAAAAAAAAPPAALAHAGSKAAPSSSSSTGAGKGGGKQRKRTTQPEDKMQQHMEREDRRVEVLVEGILYHLLPACLDALLPNCEDPLTKMDPECCRVSVPQHLLVDLEHAHGDSMAVAYDM